MPANINWSLPNPESAKCPNPDCGSDNPPDKKFCGDCGCSLKPDLAQAVKLAIAEQFKDREVLELEIAQAVAARVWGWAKTFGAIMGVAVTVFVPALAIAGYTQVSDINKT